MAQFKAELRRELTVNHLHTDVVGVPDEVLVVLAAPSSVGPSL